MMKEKGFEPVIFPANVDETLPFDMDMESAVMYLALKKALWVEANAPASIFGYSGTSNEALIIAADTVVYSDRIIGKPETPEEAFRILSALRGTCHCVATGVCFIKRGTPVRKVFCDVTKVFFKDYSDEDLWSYVRTDEPYDKAGGYAIQGTFAKYIDHIEGDYDNVVGFPWHRIEAELSKL